MFGNIRHIIAIAILLLLGASAYYLATHDNFFTGHKDRAAKIDAQTQDIERDIILPLRSLSRVNIDTEFFESPAFSALKDESVTLYTPALVRPNPFAPTN